MLAKPTPNPKLPALTGGYLYGKGMALASKGRIDEAKATLSQLQQLAASLPADTPAGFNSAKRCVRSGHCDVTGAHRIGRTSLR